MCKKGLDSNGRGLGLMYYLNPKPVVRDKIGSDGKNESEKLYSDRKMKA